MTEKHLKYIFMECGLSIDEKNISKLYAPEYEAHKITLENLLTLNKRTFCFDWFLRGFEFLEGSVSCTGVEIVFKNAWFPKILVYPMYDYMSGKIYNSVLAIPNYTDKDREGRKRIRQCSHIVRCERDLDNYFKKLFKKFECPKTDF